MSRTDELTKKGPLFGNKRSHAWNHSRRKWNVNLQNVQVKCGKSKKTVRVSARTIKTLKKQNKLV